MNNVVPKTGADTIVRSHINQTVPSRGLGDIEGIIEKPIIN